MDLALLRRRGPCEWELPAQGAMRVPALIYADEALVRAMDDKVREQAANVAALPGIVRASYVMPDAHWGYGFPIGGVAAFDAEAGGVVSAGGVGFDVSCGVRCLHTGLQRSDIMAVQRRLADALYERIPAGVGSTGSIRLGAAEMDAMLAGGAKWAVQRGWGTDADLDRVEEQGQMLHAKPGKVSEQAKRRQRDEMGTLGSGNHYLEVQEVAEVFDARIAAGFGLAAGDIVVMIHCGSRGLGHQIGSEFLREMAIAAPRYGIVLPDRELACAPIRSELGQDYLGAMRAAINCALANRQILTALVRAVFAELLPRAVMPLLYDVSHNTCKLERHEIDGQVRELYVHRKGATRALGPGHTDLPAALREFGQPVLIGGSMGTGSYVLAGTTRQRRAGVLVGLPRRGPRDEPPPGAAHLVRPPGHRRTRRPRHPDPQPVVARCRRGSPGRLQGCQRRRRRRPRRRPGPQGRAHGAAGVREGMMSHTVRLFLAGDVMTGRGIDQALAQHCDPVLYEEWVHDAREYLRLAERASGPIAAPLAPEAVWGDALAELDRAQPDLRIVNLETAITTAATPWPHKGIHYRMHPGNVGVLTAARIDACVLANNHVLDWGRDGLHETLHTLRGAGIACAGAGADRPAAWAPARLAAGGQRVLLFALGLESSGVPAAWAATAGDSGIAVGDEPTAGAGRRVAGADRGAAPPRRSGDRIAALGRQLGACGAGGAARVRAAPDRQWLDRPGARPFVASPAARRGASRQADPARLRRPDQRLRRHRPARRHAQ